MSAAAETITAPYLLGRRQADEYECAIWRLAEGPRALAIFLTAEAATNYAQSVVLPAEWRAFQPSPEDLLEIFRQSQAAGITWAVLDPDATSGKRLFNLNEILATPR